MIAEEARCSLEDFRLIFLALARVPEPGARAVARQLHERDDDILQLRVAGFDAKKEIHLLANQLLQTSGSSALIALVSRFAHGTRLLFATRTSRRRVRPA